LVQIEWQQAAAILVHRTSDKRLKLGAADLRGCITLHPLRVYDEAALMKCLKQNYEALGVSHQRLHAILRRARR